MSEGDLYYIQYSGQYVGNSMLWWRENGCGYTTNIEQAGTFSSARAYGQNESRAEDIPWRKVYIDARMSFHVNVDHVNKSEEASR